MTDGSEDEMTDDDIIGLIDDDGKALTRWEIGFVESMTAKLASGNTLTTTERAKAEQIYSERVA